MFFALLALIILCVILGFVTENGLFFAVAVFLGVIIPLTTDITSGDGTDCYTAWDGTANRIVCD